MKRRSTLALCAGAIVLGLGAGSLASWVATGVPPSATALVFGTLDLRDDEILPGVEGPVWFDASVPGSPRQIDPATFLAGPGDTVRMGRMFTLDAEGDNLDYELRVEWLDAPDLPAGVTASFSLTENPKDPPRSTVHADHVALGTPVTIPAAGEGDRTFLLDVDLRFADDRADRSLDDVSLTDIGRVAVVAEQVREGVLP